jgi:hypothetical protein
LVNSGETWSSFYSLESLAEPGRLLLPQVNFDETETW